MRKISFLLLLGILAFSLESCSSKSNVAEESAETVVTEVTTDIAQKKQNQKKQKKVSKARQPKEFEASKREENVAGLIPATKPNARVGSSIRGRQDPFAVVAIKPNIKYAQEQPSARNERPRKNSQNQISSTPILEEPGEIPTAGLAENVLITGLIELGDRIKLIVQAPEETSTRYVEIGQYLSNGQVLVKRIEPGFPTPTVVLEQDGIEVTKVVGKPEEEVGIDSDTNALSDFDRESIINPLSWLSNE